MQIRDFLDALQVEGSQDYLLATVLEGEQQGAALLLRGGVPVFGGSSLLAAHLPALQACTATGVLSVGGVSVFAERFGAGPRLVVCGGGHVAVAVVEMAKLLDLPVTALEDRREYADALRAAGADCVRCGPFAEELTKVSGGAETYFIVVTRAHAYDLDCLKVILQKPAAYVGMMGSRGRAGLVRRQLLEAGADPARVERLHAPIGLAIGARSAQEIALSILAQIVEIKSSRQLTEGFTPEMITALEECAAAGEAAALATIVRRHGSTPRELGAKMLVRADGSAVGSVGGGMMEHRARQLAGEMLAGREASPQLASYDLDALLASEDAALAACGGSMELLLQVWKGGKHDEA